MGIIIKPLVTEKMTAITDKLLLIFIAIFNKNGST